MVIGIYVVVGLNVVEDIKGVLVVVYADVLQSNASNKSVSLDFWSMGTTTGILSSWLDGVKRGL